MRVLVVDDSPTMRRIITNTLKKLGYVDIAEAGDGVEAIQHVAAARPALILTDWNMPRMGGEEFIKTVRQNREMRNVPVLVVATRAESADVVLALQTGFDDYVLKPFTAETLKQKVERLVRRMAA